ncbi:carbohydrate-binding module family 21 protein [Peniophora sp. CONT]|nr:carbohydrate-binding module family 21 protein [Peniophora sp. CONT]
MQQPTFAGAYRPRRASYRVNSSPHHRYLSLDVSASSPQSNGSAPPLMPLRSRSSSPAPTTVRPLKPSLKSYNTSPILPSDESSHVRTYSNPEPLRKSVQFNETALESIRLYRPTGRPARLLISSAAASDTETETESDGIHLQPATPPWAPLEMDFARSTPVGRTELPLGSSVLLESLSLPHATGPTVAPILRGMVLVRNVSFEKEVTVRFTLDGWETISEVRATYAGHAAPEEFHQDVVGESWDRFRFSISLPDSPDRTLQLAVRYIAPGKGEWWDSNGGANYTVALRRARALAAPIIGSSVQLPVSLPKRKISSAHQRRASIVGTPLQAVQEQALATGVFVTSSNSGSSRVVRANRSWAWTR